MFTDQPNLFTGLIVSFLFLIGTKLTCCYKLIGIDLQRNPSSTSNGLLTSAPPPSQLINLWINGIIPYRFSPKFDDWGRSEIQFAMNMIESVSCVKFIEAQQSVEDYVLISPGRGCSSEVGKVGGRQDLYLDTPYCMDRGTILHELLHTLGLMHEHARPDRDNYITINWSNIDDKHRRNFKLLPKLLADFYSDEPYDYKSIMHYSSSMWSVDPKLPTIKPKDPVISVDELGYHLDDKTLSPNDIRKIQKLYKCNQVDNQSTNYLRA